MTTEEMDLVDDVSELIREKYRQVQARIAGHEKAIKSDRSVLRRLRVVLHEGLDRTKPRKAPERLIDRKVPLTMYLSRYEDPVDVDQVASTLGWTRTHVMVCAHNHPKNFKLSWRRGVAFVSLR